MNAPAGRPSALSATLARLPKSHDLLADGAFVREAPDGRTIGRARPAHGVPVPRDPQAGPTETEAAVLAAHRAFDSGRWPPLTGAERARFLHRAAVRSRSFELCLTIGRKVRAGTVWMNTFTDGFPELPFGGYRQSGLGRELGPGAVEDYTETKTLHMHHGSRTAWWSGERASVQSFG